MRTTKWKFSTYKLLANNVFNYIYFDTLYYIRLAYREMCLDFLYINIFTGE